MKAVSTKKILVAISGGIACYKVAELVRLAKKDGHEIQVMMTRAATRFVTPLTFQALSGKPVLSNLWRPEAPDGMDHIRLADQAELAILAPASADMLGRLAHGVGRDLVTTTLLAYRGPLLVAPAMNDQMFDQPAVQENLRTLAYRGVEIVGPGSGDLACGHVGAGRMSEPEEIWEKAKLLLVQQQDLVGMRVLVTAGPTREPLDAVRFLTNHSTGKMGYAIAQAAAARGAQTVLISGPTHLATPRGVERMDVTTAREMHAAVMEQAACDVVVMAAAVGDFSFKQELSGKVNRRNFPATLELTPNPDILADLGAQKKSRGLGPYLVGFSMETQELLSRTGEKLTAKQVDLMVGNSLDDPHAGFSVDTNRVVVVSRHRPLEQWPVLPKIVVAHRLWDRIREELTAAEPMISLVRAQSK